MVDFEMTMGGYAVKVNDKPFGFISKENGFFTDPTVVRGFMEISPADLRTIAKRSEEELAKPRG